MSEERSPKAVDISLGQRIRARRLAIGMSQERLAELLGITFQQVQKYEKGVNRVAASRLFDMAAALDTDVAKFFEGLRAQVRADKRDRDDHQAVIDRVLATSEGQELLGLFASVKSVRVRRRLLELARAMTEEEGEPGVARHKRA